MTAFLRWMTMLGAVFVSLSSAQADKYGDAIAVFNDAGESSHFFKTAYGYSVFPSIGKGGVGIGGAHGTGHVYVADKLVGESKMTQVTVGLQLGGQVFSQIIFFEDKRAFDEFTSGNFEFGAEANAVAITAGASASAGTTGTSAGASGGQKDATTSSVGAGYHKGMAVFTVAKGGLMYAATLGGQKYSYKKL